MDEIDLANIDGGAYFVECPIESLGTQGGPSKVDNGKKKVMVESSEEEVDSDK